MAHEISDFNSDDLHSVFREAVVKVRQDSEKAALTGRYRDDPTPTADLPDGMIWARQGETGVPMAVHNVNVPTNKSDNPVVLEPLRNGYQVKGVDPIRGPETFGEAATDFNHGDQHGDFSSDIPNSKLRELRVRLSTAGGLTFVMEDGVYLKPDGTLGALEAGPGAETLFTLTNTCASGKKAIYLIGIDSATGAVVTDKASDVNRTTPPNVTPFATLTAMVAAANASSAADVWAFAVVLSYGQTAVNAVDDFVNLRAGTVGVGITGGGGSGSPAFGAGVIKTLSSDVIAAGSDRHLIVAAQTGTADNLIEITGLSAGDEVIIRADSGDTITVKHNDAGATDKILLYNATDIALSGDKTLKLVKTESGKVVQYVDEQGSGGGGAAELGYAEVTSSATIASATPTNITGLGVTVTVGSDPILITVWLGYFALSVGSNSRAVLSLLEDGVSVCKAYLYLATQTPILPTTMMKRRAPSAGSHTYQVQWYVDTGTGTFIFYADADTAAFILVETS